MKPLTRAALFGALFVQCIACLGQGLALDSHGLQAIRDALNAPIPQQVLEQARQNDEQILRTGRIRGQAVRALQDHRTERVARIATRVLHANRMDPSKWTIRVLDTSQPTLNAFVFGGYYAYFYSGLVDAAQSDDELAFVFGHEIGHVLLNQQRRRGEDLTQLLAQLAQLSALMSSNAERKDKRGLFAGALQASYTREDEAEADAFAAWVVHRAGFNPARGIQFFRTMEAYEAREQQRRQSELGAMRVKAEGNMANCNALKSKLNSQLLRTPGNVARVNEVCRQAFEEVQAYNATVGDKTRQGARETLLATHPVNSNRIEALRVTEEYLFGRRPLQSLAYLENTYPVLVALSERGAPPGAAAGRALPQPATGFYAPASRFVGESCNSNSDCTGSLHCVSNLCADAAASAGRAPPAPVGFPAQSRTIGESCNSNSDCVGELRCESGQCRP